MKVALLAPAGAMLEPVLYEINKFSICLCSKTIKNEIMEVFYI